MKQQAPNLLLFRSQLFSGTPRHKIHTPQNQQGPPILTKQKKQRKRSDGLDEDPMLRSQNYKAKYEIPGMFASIQASPKKNQVRCEQLKSNRIEQYMSLQYKENQDRQGVKTTLTPVSPSIDFSTSTKNMANKIRLPKDSQSQKHLMMRISALNGQSSFKSPKAC